MGSVDSDHKFSNNCFARSREAKLAHNRRERERRRKTTRTFENIRQLLGFFGYEPSGTDKPAILHSVQVALLHEALKKGLLDRSSELTCNIEADGEEPVTARARKRSRENELEAPSSESSFFNDSFYSNTLPQVIVDESFTIKESNALFEQSLHANGPNPGRSVLEVCHSDSHAMLEQSLATVFNQLRKKRSTGKNNLEVSVECRVNLRKTEGFERVKCTASGFVSESIPFAQLNFTRATLPAMENTSKEANYEDQRNQWLNSGKALAPDTDRNNLVSYPTPVKAPRQIAPAHGVGPPLPQSSGPSIHTSQPMPNAAVHTTRGRIPKYPSTCPQYEGSESNYASQPMAYAAAHNTAGRMPKYPPAYPQYAGTGLVHREPFDQRHGTAPCSVEPRSSRNQPYDVPLPYTWPAEPYSGAFYGRPENEAHHTQMNSGVVHQQPMVPSGVPNCSPHGVPAQAYPGYPIYGNVPLRYG